MPYVDANRYLYLTTPLGANKLLLDSFRGHEAVSQMFRFELDLLAENSVAVDFDKLIGQKVSFGVRGADPTRAPRDLHGIVIELSQGSRETEFTTYRATVVPAIWILTRKFRSRIFQHIKVPDLLKQLFAGFDIALEIQGTFEPREYITQYQETDFAFAGRLMEEEGIFYFFRFTPNAHKLVLTNTPQSHLVIPGKSELPYATVPEGNENEETVLEWQKEQFWGSGKYTLWDHSFELPHRHLDATQTVIDAVTVGKVSHKLKLAGNEEFEILEHPGGYASHFDGVNKTGGLQPAELQKIFQDNKRTTAIRMEQTEMPMLLTQGASNCRQITSGHKFTLVGHFNGDGQYAIIEASHQAAEGSFRSEGDSGAEPRYHNSFSCIPLALPYRPQRFTARPSIHGSLTAVVVGPDGEEIFTDPYGRIKVKFMWDPSATNTDNSCWARVSTAWAGGAWGSIHIPRIGQEVVVSFLNGDPDRPLVTGSVYNPDQMPPYKLPEHKSVSTLKSRSTKQGSKNNYNELRFEDLKGKEQVFLQAERDKDERVKSESREFVGGNRNLIVRKNQRERVQASKHSEVNADYVFETGGNKDLHTKGSIFQKTEGNHERSLGGNHIEKIDGSVSLTVAKSIDEKSGTKFAHEAGQEIHLKAGMKVVIEAGAELTLIGPGGFIGIGPSGVTIQGTVVLINSGGAAGHGSGSSPKPPTTEVRKPSQPSTADDGTAFDKL